MHTEVCHLACDAVPCFDRQARDSACHHSTCLEILRFCRMRLRCCEAHRGIVCNWTRTLLGAGDWDLQRVSAAGSGWRMTAAGAMNPYRTGAAVDGASDLPALVDKSQRPAAPRGFNFATDGLPQLCMHGPKQICEPAPQCASMRKDL